MKKLPKIISQEEFELIFKEAKKLRDKSKKNKKRINQYMIAMILGFEAGLRISEIVGYHGGCGREYGYKEWKIKPLNKSQIDINSIRIKGKGDKERVVPRPKRFSAKAVKELPLLIKRRSLQRFTTKLGKEVLDKHITFHTLRHGFGSHLANEGRPLHEIQMLLGHADIGTTGIYLHANPVNAIKSAQEVF